VPDVVISEGIKFKIGAKTDGRANALVCKGQEIMLPDGKYNRLYILAAADEDTQGLFTTGTQEIELGIQNWTGFIGQWDNRVFNEEFREVNSDGHFTLKSITPGFIKRDTIAWFGKHRHSQTANDAYRLTYMFKYALDIPIGCKSVILPDNEKIKIFAVTVANNLNDATKPVCLLYDDFTDNNRIY
jgi:alpha-mannosidase